MKCSVSGCGSAVEVALKSGAAAPVRASALLIAGLSRSCSVLHEEVHNVEPEAIDAAL